MEGSATPAVIRIFKQSLLRHTAEQTSFSRLNSKGKQPKGRRKETPFHQSLIKGKRRQEIRRKCTTCRKEIHVEMQKNWKGTSTP